MTYSENSVAKIIVASIAPEHLKSLIGGREVHFCGETLTYSELYQTLGTILGHEIDVVYSTREESYKWENEQLEIGNLPGYKFASALRTLGFGGGIMVSTDNHLYPEVRTTTWKTIAAVLLRNNRHNVFEIP